LLLEKPASQKTKQRENILDHVINTAIEQAQSYNLHAVFEKLKELALNGIQPFTGRVHEGLDYTDDHGRMKTFKIDALRQRLKRRKNGQ